MADEHARSNFDKSIAEVTVLADAELLPAVVDFVRRAAHQLGLREIRNADSVQSAPRGGGRSERVKPGNAPPPLPLTVSRKIALLAQLSLHERVRTFVSRGLP